MPSPIIIEGDKIAIVFPNCGRLKKFNDLFLSQLETEMKGVNTSSDSKSGQTPDPKEPRDSNPKKRKLPPEQTKQTEQESSRCLMR